jgi:hypothetical protein
MQSKKENAALKKRLEPIEEAYKLLRDRPDIMFSQGFTVLTKAVKRCMEMKMGADHE